MNNKVNIHVSNEDKSVSVVRCRKVSIRERFLRALLGKKQKLTVIVPGDSVSQITIIEEGERGHEPKEALI